MRCPLLAPTILFSSLALPLAAASAPRPDILIADFEGKDYGAWKATGEAFGPGPARGTLPHQMRVTGFKGKALVNSFFNGDKTTGTLTSPEFVLQRRYLTFLVGGGAHEGKTCMNLLVDGKVVRTVTGPNSRPGGSEELQPASWDVGELAGKKARLEIVDRVTGGWGHINIDQIVLTDARPPALLMNQSREVRIEKRFLHLPVSYHATKRKLSLVLDGKLVADYDVVPADALPDYWFSLDVAPWQGKTLRLCMDRLFEGSEFLPSIRQSNTEPNDPNLYKEKLRPQFHFTPKTGWTNDPNGMMYYAGEYHLFFQHNPVGTAWGNMTWGHAVSTDMLHWKELDDAIRPDELGTIFSGSGVVDHENTTGWQRGSEKPLVCIYTSAGGTSLLSQGQKFSQSIAYSVDRGRTWKKYEKNPVLPHIVGGNRDPKIVWFAPTRQWIMVLYLDKNDYGLFASPDLKRWTQLQTLTVPGSGECPDFFEIPVEGTPGQRRWVFTSAKGDYLVGTFDGKKFAPKTGPHPLRWGGNYYAVQSFNDLPAADGRRVQIAWMNGGRYPGMPFNQQMNIPSELTLHETAEGLRIFRNPVREVETLRGPQRSWTSTVLSEGVNPLKDVSADLLDIEADLEPAAAKEIVLSLHGQKLVYNVAQKRLVAGNTRLDVAPENSRVRLRILLDRTTVEVFANGGRVANGWCFVPSDDDRGLSLTATGGTARLVSMKVYPLKSVW